MPSRFHRAICWLRRDLRIHDNAALAEATSSAEEVVVVFVFDTRILDQLQDQDDKRLTLIHRSLVELDASLRENGGRLVVLHGDPLNLIPELADHVGAEAVFCSRDYEPYGQERDSAVAEALRKSGRELISVKDIVIFERGEVMSKTGQPFSVYSPYAKAWRAALAPGRDLAAREPNLRRVVDVTGAGMRDWGLEAIGFAPSELWLQAGEKAARTRLRDFSRRIGEYKDLRNLPATDGTSGLSVHLRFGTISIRECVRAALDAGAAGDKWLAELIWRDFYQHILFHNPHVVREPFQAVYRNTRFPGGDELYTAWERGETGYPIVDAAMRCLNQTGWMHNRLRMVAASFLTKDLLVDYRRGEAHFARKLLDFELASNNGGWQWAAGTGCDPQPYFRIFNPVLQSEKFDPEGAFIRKWIPELAELPSEYIHAPWQAPEMELVAAGVELGKTYPLPIVDHAQQRQAAIRFLENEKNRPKPPKLASRSFGRS